MNTEKNYKLYQATDRYKREHQKSKNYLNDVDFIYNDDLFSLSRNDNYTFDERVKHIMTFAHVGYRLAKEMVENFQDMPVAWIRENNKNKAL